ncbi:nuclear transport factor 2 family protein [Oxalobacteraceae bacterium A2-2]
MKHTLLACCAALLLPATALADGAGADLTATITALDTRLFDAYNRCDLDAFKDLFVPDVEFYHDNGGLMTGRDAVVESTRKYICGKVTRKLVPGTLHIYPVKDYGGIEEGEHVFCQTGSGKCEGVAKFLMVWQHKEGQWRMTRIVSYGHRELTAAEQARLR